MKRPYVKCLTPRCECERGHENRGDPDHMDSNGQRWNTNAARPRPTKAKWPRDRDGNYPCESMTTEEMRDEEGGAFCFVCGTRGKKPDVLCASHRNREREMIEDWVRRNRDTVRLIAEILAGIQVSGSMGKVGAATEPWRALRDRLGLFGWHTADEAETALRKTLTETATDD